MKSWQKMLLMFCCLIGMVTSFLFTVRGNITWTYELRAPVHVNIEIDRAFIHSVSIIADMTPRKLNFTLSADSSSKTPKVILYTDIYNYYKSWVNTEPPLIHRLFLCVQNENLRENLNAIENISVFIGNKLFYFSGSDIAALQGVEEGNNTVYDLPGLEYKKSIMAALFKMPPFLNWYGDFNLVFKMISIFFSNPFKFFFTWCFIFALLFIYRSSIRNIYSRLGKSKFSVTELLLLGLIIITGFTLRINGYDRYSSWYDELYSVCIASNPNLPFMNTFVDPGNPPFYFILLRFWFILFEWTEQSGRILSVLIGTAAIIPFYIIIKRFTDKESALLAALYMAVSAYFIGYSQEMRGYILVVFLVTIAAHRFLIIVQKQDLGLVNILWYIIPSVLLVNTHYYGALFVFATFLFYVTSTILKKTFTWKKIAVFFAGNVIIAFSLLPYFIRTALNRALLDQNFNTHISKPNLLLICMAVIIPFLAVIYTYLRKVLFKNSLSSSHKYFLDYSVFIIAAIYLIAFAASFYRPILKMGYLVILHPFIIAIIAVILVNIVKNNFKLIGGVCICFAFALITEAHNSNYGGGSDVYQEAMAYIAKDAEANQKNVSMEISPLIRNNIYGYKELPVYNTGNAYDVLYFNPFHTHEEIMYLQTEMLGIDRSNILKIKINGNESVFKIYNTTLSN